MYISRLRSGSEAYYFGRRPEVSARTDEVLSWRGTDPQEGFWAGAGAQRRGLEGPVARPALAALMAGLDPGDGEVLGRAHNRVKVAAWDLVFAAPKSVSVLWALGDAGLRETVWKAHLEAVCHSVEALEKVALAARRRSGGEDRRIACEGMFGGVFLHGLSRAGDPHLHSHVVAPNLVRGEDGAWSALDSGGIFAFARAAGLGYHSHLRAVLARETGCRFAPSARGTVGIVGLPEALVEEFSRRQAEVRSALEQWGQSGPRPAQAAAVATRAGRDPARVAPEERRDSWARRAGALGPATLSKEEVASWSAMARSRLVLPPARAAEAAAGPAGYFRIGDLYAAQASRALDGALWAELHEAANEALAESTKVVGSRALALYAPSSTLAARRSLRSATTAFRTGLQAHDGMGHWRGAGVVSGGAGALPTLVAAVELARRGGQGVGVLAASAEQAEMVEVLTGALASPRIADLGAAEVLVVADAHRRHPAQLDFLARRAESGPATLFVLASPADKTLAGAELCRLAGGSVLTVGDLAPCEAASGRLVGLGREGMEVLVASGAPSLVAGVAQGAAREAAAGRPPVVLVARSGLSAVFDGAIRAELGARGLLGEQLEMGGMSLAMGESVRASRRVGQRAGPAKVVGFEAGGVLLRSSEGRESRFTEREVARGALSYLYSASPGECSRNGLSPRLVVGGAALAARLRPSLRRNSNLRFHAAALRDASGRELPPAQLYEAIREMVEPGMQRRQEAEWGPSRRRRLALAAASRSFGTTRGDLSPRRGGVERAGRAGREDLLGR